MTYLNAESFDIVSLSASIKTKKKEIDALLIEVDKQQAHTPTISLYTPPKISKKLFIQN